MNPWPDQVLDCWACWMQILGLNLVARLKIAGLVYIYVDPRLTRRFRGPPKFATLQMPLDLHIAADAIQNLEYELYLGA